MKFKWLVLGMLAFAILSGFFMESCKNKPALCAVCKREIHRGFKTTLLVSGKKEVTCCIACAMHFRNTMRDVSLAHVTDYETGNEIAPETAVYLYGPDIQTCGEPSKAVRTGDSALYVDYDRCEPAVLAFRNQQQAISVQKDHGGKVVTLAELQDLFGMAGATHHH